MGGRGGSGPSQSRERSGGAATAVDGNALADADIRDAVEDVLNITGQTSQWVTLQRLRTALSTRGWSEDRQDEQLTRFVREGKASLLVEEDAGLVTKAVRRSALAYGDENYHLIRLKN